MVSEDESDDKKQTNNKSGVSGRIQPLNMTGSLSHNWGFWLQSFKIYLRATGYEQESDQRKVAMLLHLIGNPALIVFNSFNVDIDNITYKELVSKFENYFVPKKNITMERHNFFSRMQTAEESIEDFVTDLTNKSLTCDFGDLREDLIKDILICGLNDSNHFIKQHLLREENVNLQKAIEICKTLQLTQQGAEQLRQAGNFVGAVNVRGVSRKHHIQQQQEVESRLGVYSNSRETKMKICNRCGQQHKAMRCPAMGATCNLCKKPNHYAKVCRNKKALFNVNIDDTVNAEEQSDNEFFVVGQINNKEVMSGSWYIDLVINKVRIEAMIDTGCKINVMSVTLLKSLNVSGQKIESCQYKLKDFSGRQIPVVGKYTLTCVYDQGKKNDIEFVIVDISCITIVGIETSVKLNFIGKSKAVKTVYCNNIDNFETLFKGLGCINKTCHLYVDTCVRPIVDPPRKVPFKLREKLKSELERMERLDVISKVTEPTDWVNSIVIVEKKNGGLRICLDPRNLNKAIQRERYPIPTLDNIRSSLVGATVFSTLDANSGFWMIPLDEESSKLCTFNSPFGRFKFNRLPYGIKAAPEIFHRIMTEAFGDLPGVSIYIDDLLIWGQTMKEHDERLLKVMSRATELNVKFNMSKCKIRQSQVKYLGNVFSNEGMHPDEDKIKAIREMPSPNNVKDLQRFLGMVNYIGSYIKNLAIETETLRSLLQKKSDWQWNACYEEAYNKLKNIVCSSSVLTHFDVNSPIVLSVDACQSALGAVILQNNKPVAYASKTLGSSQRNYASIERELYAIVFGCQRFHQYVYGQKVTVETDHKPLVTLFKKSLADVPVRLQRMLMRLQAYDLDVVYKPGHLLYIADTLSRAPLPEIEYDMDEDIMLHVNLLYNSLAVSNEMKNIILEETSKDKSLQTLISYCHNGWPEKSSLIENSTKPYFNIKSDIHVIHGIVFKGTSVIVPQSLRQHMLKLIHEGHFGIERSKNQVRGILFWPGMSTEITNMVGNCNVCLKYRSANSKEPLMPSPITTLPWEIVAIDFLEFRKTKYLIVVDFYSKFIEVAQLKSTNAESTIIHLKSIFARHGIPLEIRSDNGPPFESHAFKQFLTEWGITHITSSPYYARANGLAESSVKIIKNILEKAYESNADPYIALLQLRNTPKGERFSPAQLLMSRQIRSKLPVLASNLKPKVIEYSQYAESTKKQQENMKKYHDKTAKSLAVLQPGEKVMFKLKPDSPWSPAIIKKCLEKDMPRSYIVQSNDGTEYRRNRIHILKLNRTHNSNITNTNCQTSSIVDHLIKCHNNDNNNNDNNIENIGDSNAGYVRTRSGRVIKPPRRFTFTEDELRESRQ